jgi:hypothetical protein
MFKKFSGVWIMAYTDIDKPSDYFNTKLYTGNGGTQSISGLDFAPDWVWIKDRGSALNHIWFDSVRGIDKYFYGNLTEAEGTSATILTAVGSDGFTVGANNNVNENTKGIVSWNWKANGAGVSNTDGSITSTVSANTTSGFSIVTFTSTGSTSTIGHGLGSAPAMIIGKRRDSTSTWTVGHQSLGWTKFLRLEDTTAVGTETGWWNNTNPTSTVFTHGTNWSAGTWVAYCFAEKKGFSKFGSYTGNGSADGTFVYTGFKPAWTLIKRTDSATGGSWILFDNKRGANVINPVDVVMSASNNQSESDWGTTYDCDYLSNGFKWRYDGTAGYNNTSGGTYIYMAFAQNPLVGSNGVPCTAR